MLKDEPPDIINKSFFVLASQSIYAMIAQISPAHRRDNRKLVVEG